MTRSYTALLLRNTQVLDLPHDRIPPLSEDGTSSHSFGFLKRKKRREIFQIQGTLLTCESGLLETTFKLNWLLAIGNHFQRYN